MNNEFDNTDPVNHTEPENTNTDKENVPKDSGSGENSSFYHYTYEKGSNVTGTADSGQNSQSTDNTYRQTAGQPYSGAEGQAFQQNNSQSYQQSAGNTYQYSGGPQGNGNGQGYGGYGNYQSYYQQEPPKPEKPKKEKQPHKRGLGYKIAVAACLALVFGVVGGAAFQATNYFGSKITGQDAVTASGKNKIETAKGVDNGASVKDTQGSAAGTEAESKGVNASSGSSDGVAAVAKNSMPSIVAITNKSVKEVQDLFFGTTQREAVSSGSGVIIDQNDSELLIATNNHVVDGAEELSVYFTVDVEDPESSVVQAQVKGTDPDHDLAVVAVNLADIPEDVKEQIKIATLGDSDALEVGQQAIAIGNALGYGQSLTAGYISALDREVTVDDITNSMIQTDAAINFGNSGGALLNIKGELIGINSVKAAASGVEGMGYAIPINTAKPILDELMNRTTRSKVEEEEKGYMGITPQNVSEEAKQVYNMPSGAFVYQVTEGSPAEQVGIHKGDIITKVDGVSVGSATDLLERMKYYKIGETIDVVVATADNGEYIERTVSITLGERPETAASSDEGQQQRQLPDNSGGIFQR